MNYDNFYHLVYDLKKHIKENDSVVHYCFLPKHFLHSFMCNKTNVEFCIAPKNLQLTCMTNLMPHLGIYCSAQNDKQKLLNFLNNKDIKQEDEIEEFEKFLTKEFSNKSCEHPLSEKQLLECFFKRGVERANFEDFLQKNKSNKSFQQSIKDFFQKILG